MELAHGGSPGGGQEAYNGSVSWRTLLQNCPIHWFHFPGVSSFAPLGPSAAHFDLASCYLPALEIRPRQLGAGTGLPDVSRTGDAVDVGPVVFYERRVPRWIASSRNPMQSS